MSVLSFYIDEKDKSKVEVKLEKHMGENEKDLSFLWGKYALSLSKQLNFNEIKVNPFSEDQGGQIHFLSDKIINENNLNEYGYIKGSGELDDDFEDDDFFQPTLDDTFVPEDVFSGRIAIRGKPEYVHIVLDLHNASSIVGGLLTPTAISTNAIYEATKKHAEEVTMK